MSVFEVVAVEPEARPWNSKHGSSFLSYTVSLRNEQDEVRRAEWSRKDTSPAPRVGELVDGHMEPGNYGLKFKMNFEATKAMNERQRAERYIPNTPQAPANPIPPAQIQGGPTVPTQKDQSIARMAAQKVAAIYVLAQAQAGQAGQVTPQYVAQVADFFEQDARR